MRYWRNIAKTAAVALAFCLLITMTHTVLAFGTSAAESVTGKPSFPLLITAVCVQAALLVAAYSMVKVYLPPASNWGKGLLFAGLFLVSVQIPSVLGIIVCEPGNEWEFFTAPKIANYVSLFDDIVAILIAGIVIGLLFPVAEGKRAVKTKGLWLSMVIGATLFPVAMFVAETGIMRLSQLEDDHISFVVSLWFSTVFFGVFFLTGLCLPMLQVIAKRTGHPTVLGRLCYSLVVFSLVWFPVQNFMIVFGWQALGGIIFSVVSLIPIALVLVIADRLIVLLPSESESTTSRAATARIQG